LVTQREIGQSTLGFDRAVRSSLRADPNVLMVGEMRDRETVLAVLEAAETGLLVLSTLHTNSAIKSVQRILSLSNQNEKDALRAQLSNILQAVICQQLVPLVDGGRQAVHEVMVRTASVAEAIELGEYDKLEEYIKNGSFDGMQAMDESLHRLYSDGLIEADTAVAAAVNQDAMTRALRGAS
jgi:twitching motility protein PilT